MHGTAQHDGCTAKARWLKEVSNSRSSRKRCRLRARRCAAPDRADRLAQNRLALEVEQLTHGYVYCRVAPLGDSRMRIARADVEVCWAHVSTLRAASYSPATACLELAH